MASLLEIKQASGSLAIFLQSQEDEHVVVELTDGTQVSGIIEHADAHMKYKLKFLYKFSSHIAIAACRSKMLK
jgi:small nuclear ribonucleoprotein (snRNP)-like protein